jgi:Protein of unknown function (DUF1778)
LRGQKLSEFTLESARRQAEDTLLDQRTFFLDDASHARFVAYSMRHPKSPPKPTPASDARRRGGRNERTPEFLPPEPLNVKHDVSRFADGVYASLDAWLRERAHQIEGLSARIYVVCPSGEADRVVAYFCISAAVEQRNALPSAKMRRGMPEQVPLWLIGRLAVDA